MTSLWTKEVMSPIMSLVETIMLGSHVLGAVLHTVLPGESPNECIVKLVTVWMKGDKLEHQKFA